MTTAPRPENTEGSLSPPEQTRPLEVANRTFAQPGLGLPDGTDLWAPKPLFSSFLRSGYSAGAISIALPCRMLFCSGTWENLTLSQPGAKSHTPFHLLNHVAFYQSLTAFYGG